MLRRDSIQLSSFFPKGANESLIFKLLKGRPALQVSRAINQEAELSRQDAASLEEILENAKVAMKRSMRRLNRALEQSKSNHMLYLMVFVLACFLMIYLWAKVYRLVKWLL